MQVTGGLTTLDERHACLYIMHTCLTYTWVDFIEPCFTFCVHAFWRWPVTSRRRCSALHAALRLGLVSAVHRLTLRRRCCRHFLTRITVSQDVIIRQCVMLRLLVVHLWHNLRLLQPRDCNHHSVSTLIPNSNSEKLCRCIISAAELSVCCVWYQWIALGVFRCAQHVLVRQHPHAIQHGHLPRDSDILSAEFS